LRKDNINAFFFVHTGFVFNQVLDDAVGICHALITGSGSESSFLVTGIQLVSLFTPFGDIEDASDCYSDQVMLMKRLAAVMARIIRLGSGVESKRFYFLQKLLSELLFGLLHAT